MVRRDRTRRQKFDASLRDASTSSSNLRVLSSSSVPRRATILKMFSIEGRGLNTVSGVSRDALIKTDCRAPVCRDFDNRTQVRRGSNATPPSRECPWESSVRSVFFCAAQVRGLWTCCGNLASRTKSQNSIFYIVRQSSGRELSFFLFARTRRTEVRFLRKFLLVLSSSHGIANSRTKNATIQNLVLRTKFA